MSGLTRTRRLGWKAVLGIILVPLTIAGLFIWGLWSPTDRLRSVEAAVVNLDQPVEIDGQLTPLGRVFAGALVGDSTVADDETNFTWHLTNADDAAEGLDEGRYATVVTIPENFSAAATSGSDPDTAEQATIDIATSDRGRLIDSALSNVVTSTATRVLNEQLGTAFVDQVFVGMGTLHTSLGEAAEGADKLAGGSHQLADGATGLADGTAQLSTGAGALASGAGELSSGVGTVATGVSDLASGLNEYAAGGQKLAGLAQQAAGGTAQYTGGVSMYSGEVSTHVQTLNEAIALAGECTASGASAAFCKEYQTIVGTMAGLNVSSYSLGVVAGKGAEVAAGSQGLADGIGTYVAGAGEIAAGAGQLAGGASQLATGAGSLASGAQQLAAGTPALADGAAKLAEGAQQAATGTDTLASGLGQAVDGVPNYTESQRDALARAALTPVVATGSGDELFNAAGVPLFTGIALWAGGLASFLILSPLWRRTREAARGLGAITLRSALPGFAAGAAQGAVVGLAMPIALGLDLPATLAFLGFGVLAGVAFALMNQGLAALLGGFGRFLSFVTLVIAFAGGIVSTAPAALRAIGDATPIGAAFSGFQAIASGAAGAGSAAALLVLWALVGLALTAFAAARVRTAERAPVAGLDPAAPARALQHA